MKHPVRRRCEQSLVAVTARLARVLVRLPLKWLRGIADVAAWLVIALAPRRQRMADANIAVAFPDLSPRERRGIARRSVHGICRTMIELLALPRISREDLERLIATPDLSPVREAAQSGSGVLFITAHFGNWEWLGAHLAHQVAPLAVVALDHKHGGVADIINAARASHGVRMLGRDDTREMLRILGSGGMLGMLPDQHAPKAASGRTSSGNRPGRSRGRRCWPRAPGRGSSWCSASASRPVRCGWSCSRNCNSGTRGTARKMSKPTRV